MSEAEAVRELVSLVIGYQVRASRHQRNLSQADLSQGIVSQSMMSLLESGRQFPQSDVLQLIAERLEDPTLASYAHLLSGGQWSIMDFASTNHELLVEVLRTHRGRWQDVHLKIALELCEHFYHKREFTITKELCRLILDHSTEAAPMEKAHYYFGSTYLFSYEYENAVFWLRRADEKRDLLDDSLRGRLQYNLGYAYCELDAYGDAVWYAKLAVDTFHRINDYVRYGKSLGLLGAIQVRLGRVHEARATLELAYDIMARWEINEADRARIAVSLADVSETEGDDVAAQQWCNCAITAGNASADDASVSAAYQTLCLVYLSRNETQKATEAIRDAMLAAAKSKDGRSTFQSHLLAAGVLPNREERVLAAEVAYTSAKDAKLRIQQALAADCLASLIEQQDVNSAENYRSVAMQLYREQLVGAVMSSSAFRYLPVGPFYDS